MSQVVDEYTGEVYPSDEHQTKENVEKDAFQLLLKNVSQQLDTEFDALDQQRLTQCLPYSNMFVDCQTLMYALLKHTKSIQQTINVICTAGIEKTQRHIISEVETSCVEDNKFRFGKYKNKDILTVAQKDPSYVTWCVKRGIPAQSPASQKPVWQSVMKYLNIPFNDDMFPNPTVSKQPRSEEQEQPQNEERTKRRKEWID